MLVIDKLRLLTRNEKLHVKQIHIHTCWEIFIVKILSYFIQETFMTKTFMIYST